jgi:hypothetical protein
LYVGVVLPLYISDVALYLFDCGVAVKYEAIFLGELHTLLKEGLVSDQKFGGLGLLIDVIGEPFGQLVDGFETENNE